jgi:tetratricopeptide (TPR) repeat protein
MERPSGLERSRSLLGLVKTVPPFVGRRQEIDWFTDALQDVGAGKPHVVLIPGEAGLGKTRLLHEVQALARRSGIQVYHGRCQEDVVLPYLPFVEALRTQLEQLPGVAEETSGTEAELIRQLLPRAVASTAVASAVTTAQADQDKLRLFLAVSRTLLTMAQSSPALFAVDDLHWADPSSLDLFQHLVFTLADTAEREPVPLLLVCTYRPREGGERLIRLLARIQRENICDTFTLRGLTEAEISALLQSFGLRSPSHQLTATVMQATQGNPLFIQEVFQHMVQQEALEERGGYVVTTASPSDLRLPEEVTSAIATRIQGLSEGCRRILTLAALLDDCVSPQILEAVSGMGEESLLDVLEEGIHQHLLLSEGQDWRFAHPLIRHVFYQTPSAARRQRLHQQIGQMLERLYANSFDAHLREIAHHFIRAGPVAAPETIVTYARRAGDQAFMAAAWGDAAQYYEAALSAAESIPHFPVRDRAELHYRAGLAYYWDMDAGPTIDHYEKAIAAYRFAGDIRGAARALMEQARTRYTLASVPLGTLVDIQPLEAALEALGERETALHGNILTIMSDAYSTAQQQDKAKELAQRALEIGQRLQNDRLRAYAYFVLGVAESRSLHVQAGVECFQKALASARRSDDLVLQDWPLARLPVSLMRLGRLPEVEAVGQEACDLTRKCQDWGAYSVALSALTSAAVARGDFDAAESRAHETMLMVSRSHYPWGGERALCALAYARTLRGDWAAAEAALDTLIEPGRVFREVGPVVQTTARVLRQVVHTYAGVAAESTVARGIDAMLSAQVDTYALDPLCALVELADLHHAPALAERPYQALLRAMEQGGLFSIGWVCLLPRVSGVAATLHHQWDMAEAHFQTALEVALRLEARLEIGRTYLDYARMLAVRDGKGDRPRAMTLVDQAYALLTALGVHPLVRRAAELTPVLHAG